MTHFLTIQTFEQWRTEARRLLASQIAPENVGFTTDTTQPLLFADDPKLLEGDSSTARVPRKFLDLARTVACHRSENRWMLLYRMLWRLTHGEPKLLEITTDDDVSELHQMQKSVSRDCHKMKAFVRFRKTTTVEPVDHYVAWHRPDHRIVQLVAPFFSRRFKAMNWTILTPDESVTWDQQNLQFGPGVPNADALDADALEELWKTYYGAIFNPARVKIGMMKREMPVRHWPTLPETDIIGELLEQAPQRVERMIERSEGFERTAAHFLPADFDLESLRNAANGCQACDLHQFAHNLIFGEGSKEARIMLIGEQPGDQEDVRGKPFIGPAGQLLNQALSQAGIQREDVYVTNVVKHFKYTTRGNRRLHKKPNSREIYACRPWLEAELSAVSPDIVFCLGATPAQALFGRDFRVSRQRGEVYETDWCKQTIATWHPAAILRMPDPSRREQMEEQLVHDLRLAAP